MGLFDIFKKIFSKSQKKHPDTRASGNASAKSGKKTAKHSGKGRKKSQEISLAPTDSKHRRKSTRIKADPIDEKALGFSISLKAEDEHAIKRNAIRIRVKGLRVRVPRLKAVFPVADISATGLGFKFEKPRIKSGVTLKMDLAVGKEIRAKGVLCKVRRHERGVVGCVFMDLDRAQDDAVHAIVLLGQKQQAARRAKRRDEEFKLPD
ncbi:PilZ domain-containing protein [Pseudodesulfovibrio tunisiensis]|uniref:PilZ domain-containing protein n=1 Tax=Pseudodesulfovibrio tunisiensis TaxID=463192 RepID=UPI001FB215A9|nr:PilZ domain-containing protein [Pseudodesulfovibrio tunisiensis]